MSPIVIIVALLAAVAFFIAIRAVPVSEPATHGGEPDLAPPALAGSRRGDAGRMHGVLHSTPERRCPLGSMR